MSDNNLSRHRTVRQAIDYIAAHPEGSSPDVPLEAPMNELVVQTLFRIAHSPDPRVRGSISRARRAQEIIFNRTTGLRKPGTAPAKVDNEEIEFVDLTQSEIGSNNE